MEMIQSDEHREERRQKNEQSLREMWNTIKHTKHMHIGSPRGEETGKGKEKLFREIMDENVLKFDENINLHNQKA